jgi:hypothetical protein
MQITFDTKSFAALEADALVSYLFEESDPVQGRISEIDAAAGGLLKKIAGSGEATGKTLEFTFAPGWSRKARPVLQRHAAQSCGSGSSLPEIPFDQEFRVSRA